MSLHARHPHRCVEHSSINKIDQKYKWIQFTNITQVTFLKTSRLHFHSMHYIKNRRVRECNFEWLYEAKYVKDYKKLTMISGQRLVNRFSASPLRCLHDPLHTSRICKRVFVQNTGVSNPIKVMIEFDRWWQY